MIRDDRWPEESGELQTAVAVGCAHHRNLDALIAQPGNTSCPFSFDDSPPFELKAELLKEINRLLEVIDDDSYIIHSFERHASNLHNVVSMEQWVPYSTEDEQLRITPRLRNADVGVRIRVRE